MDKKKLFIGSLPWSMSGHSLRALFEEFGEIIEVVIISDRDTGRSKGFGFITFATEEAAEKAKSAMNGKDVEGRSIIVNTAKPREEKRSY